MKRYEFWDPRLFNLPFYAYLAIRTVQAGIHPKTLFKANYALENGDLRASKFRLQQTVGAAKFPPTLFVADPQGIRQKKRQVMRFAGVHHFPVIAKPDIGECGKAVKLIHDEAQLDQFLPLISSDYLIQPVIPLPVEYGIFYVRYRGRPRIIGINGKTFPHVRGNGRDTLKRLIHQNPRYSHHWRGFIHDTDLGRIPAPGEIIRLSQIGSHTMGCMFTDKTHLTTPLLENAVYGLLEDVPGVNFSRLDVRAESKAEFQKGKFQLIEINGVSSLPTEMFDPQYSVFDAYRIFFRVADWLVKIAKENRYQPMKPIRLRRLFRQLQQDGRILEETHRRLLQMAGYIGATGLHRV